jgi:hypothetical protein
LADFAVQTYFSHTSTQHSRHVYKYYLSQLISHRKFVTTTRTASAVSRDSLHIRLAKWRLSDLRERLIFSNKVFTRVSFCSFSDSSSIVIGCLTFFVAFVLFKVIRRSEQRYKYLLSFQDLPRASTFANVVACNWAIADVGQDPFDVDNHGKRSKWINLFSGRQIAFSMMEILK